MSYATQVPIFIEAIKNPALSKETRESCEEMILAIARIADQANLTLDKLKVSHE